MLGCPSPAPRVAPQAQIVGDDLLCTNPKRVQKAIDTKACNALLLKVGWRTGCQLQGRACCVLVLRVWASRHTWAPAGRFLID